MSHDISHRTPAELAKLDEVDLLQLRQIAMNRIDVLRATMDCTPERDARALRELEEGIAVWQAALDRYEEAERIIDAEWSRLMAGDFSSHPGLV